MKIITIEKRKQPDGSYISVPKATRVSKYIPHRGVKRGGNPTQEQKFSPEWLRSI